MNTKMNEINEKIGRYRWTICALLFFATSINYLDRQVFSILKDTLERKFNWSDTDYANIVLVFQVTYAVSLLFAGRFVDWLDTKRGYAWSLIIWSVGALIHGLSKGTGGFMFARGILGVGEAGNFPSAIKTTAEYFPKKERAFATGIFNSGANVGAILAPLCVPWMVDNWGWQAVFYTVGGIGFIWLIFWFWLYDIPSRQKRLGRKEYDYIMSDNEPPETSDMKWYKEWGKLLKYKQTWSFAFGKFMTDGVWWFFLLWLPAYLKAVYGISGRAVMWPLTVLYTMTCFGSIGGGALSMYFIRKGYEPYAGHMRAMLIIAFFPLVILFAQPLGGISFWVPVLLIGIGAAAHQGWSANIFTTVSAMFPKKSVASVTGIGGMAGGIGGIVVSEVGARVFDFYRTTGIKAFWENVSRTNLAAFAEKVRNAHLINPLRIELDKTELMNLPKEIVIQIQSNSSFSLQQINDYGNMGQKAFDAMTKNLTDPVLVDQLHRLVATQKPIVQQSLSAPYAAMFAFCAVAYLIAWIVMKILVPRYKAITEL